MKSVLLIAILAFSLSTNIRAQSGEGLFVIDSLYITYDLKDSDPPLRNWNDYHTYDYNSENWDKVYLHILYHYENYTGVLDDLYLAIVTDSLGQYFYHKGSGLWGLQNIDQINEAVFFFKCDRDQVVTYDSLIIDLMIHGQFLENDWHYEYYKMREDGLRILVPH